LMTVEALTHLLLLLLLCRLHCRSSICLLPLLHRNLGCRWR
jgi:hypothetical protein